MGTLFKRKACATCEYWAGERKVTPFKDGADVKSYTVKGICNNKKVPSHGKDVKCDHGGSCSKYEQWELIK